MMNTRFLKYKQTIEVNPTVPFNFDATFHKPDHFPSGDNEWQPNIRWQTMLWQNMQLGLKFENMGDLDRPSIAISVFSDSKLNRMYLADLISEITYRYNLQMDLSGFNQRFINDPLLGPIIHKWLGMRPLNYGSLYEYLIVAIVLQNATVRRSVNMLKTLFENYGSLLNFDDKQLYAYWEPNIIHTASEQELRDLKIGYRAKSIKRVTAAFVGKEINEYDIRNKPIEEQRKALLSLYGIGPASIGYVLFDVFHQWDDLQHISPWEQKIYSRIFFNTEPDDPVSVETLLTYFSQHFAGYRNLAVHYFWEDLFWKRKSEPVEWIEKLIRL